MTMRPRWTFQRFFGLALLSSLWLSAPIGTAAQSPDVETSDAAKAEAIDAAIAVVDPWLDRVDADAFASAYAPLGTPIQDRVSESEWVAAMKDVRTHIDAPSERERTISQYRPTMEKMDGGPFVSLLYEGSYDLGTFSEMILVRKEDAGWTIVGYQVVPDMSLLDKHDELSFEMIDYGPADHAKASDSDG
jgi:hypothetical protein